MDRDLDISLSLVNLLTLPAELLVYIIFLLLRDRIKLRYVSRWLRCVLEDHCGRSLCGLIMTVVKNAV